MKIDLIRIHSIMRDKGYHYFDGKTNNINDNLYLDFSTGHNGRGDWVEIKIGISHDIRYKNGEFKNISQGELFEILNTL